MSHTPEPWFIAEEPLILLNEICGNDENGDPFIIASKNYNYPDLSNANARRIVACVNACRGLSTKELEENGLVSAVGHELLNLDAQLATVTAQRDELLKALKATLGPDYEHAYNLAMDAIEKCEVQNG